MKNIVCIGGGAAGLYYALLHKKRNPQDRVVVLERNKPTDTFGWGVVFSDDTMRNLQQADCVSSDNINDAINHWDDIEATFKGETYRSTGHGFIGIGRLKMLNILQQRCEQLGVEMVYETLVEDEIEVAKKYDADLIIACDGINSFIRNKYIDDFDVDIDLRACRFSWLGTKKLFDAFTFIFEKTKFGWMSVHAYKFNEDTSTFIVEMREEDWIKAGIEDMSQDEAIEFCEKVFAKHLDGNKLISNAKHLRGSANWIRFPRIICNNWHTWKTINGKKTPIVLMGDASHTAHFSIGSGTKLALEDAICFDRLYAKNNANLKDVFKEYEVERRIEVARIKNAARNSTWWFEQVALHENMHPQQFYYSMITRSQRISNENLYMRDNDFILDYEKWFNDGSLAIKKKFNASNLDFANRFVLDVNKTDANIDYAKQIDSGAALIFTRSINLNDATVFNEQEMHDWKNLLSSAHKKDVKIAIDLGFEDGRDINTLSAEDIDNISNTFVENIKNVVAIGADIVGFDFSNGNTIARILSSITNKRDDNFGRNLENASCVALDIVKRVRAATKLPISIRISAADWQKNGFNIDNAIWLVNAIKELGADMVVVSSGGIVKKDIMTLGRVYNGCFSDEIKHKVDITVICSGNINTIDEANSLICADRADLVAIDNINIVDKNLDLHIQDVMDNRK